MSKMDDDVNQAFEMKREQRGINFFGLVKCNQFDLEFRTRMVKPDWLNQTGKSNLTSRFDWLNLDWLNVNQSDLTRPVSEFTLSS